MLFTDVPEHLIPIYRLARHRPISGELAAVLERLTTLPAGRALRITGWTPGFYELLWQWAAKHRTDMQVHKRGPVVLMWVENHDG